MTTLSSGFKRTPESIIPSSTNMNSLVSSISLTDDLNDLHPVVIRTAQEAAPAGSFAYNIELPSYLTSSSIPIVGSFLAVSEAPTQESGTNQCNLKLRFSEFALPDNSITSSMLQSGIVGADSVVSSGGSGVATLAGAQIFTGEKTFTNILVLTPTSSSQAANKDYVDTRYTAGSGLALSSSKELSVASLGVSNAMIADSTIDSTKCVLSGSNSIASVDYVDGRYTAGGGLSLSASKEFSVSALGISTAMLQNSAVDSSKCVSSGSSGVCLLGSSQTVSGSRTHSGTLTVLAPTSDMHAATKSYVDDKFTVDEDTLTKSTSTSGGYTTVQFKVKANGIGTAEIANEAVTGTQCRLSGSSGLLTIGETQTITGQKTFSGLTVFGQDKLQCTNVTLTTGNYTTKLSAGFGNVSNITLDLPGTLPSTMNSYLKCSTLGVCSFQANDYLVLGKSSNQSVFSGSSVTFFEESSSGLSLNSNNTSFTLGPGKRYHVTVHLKADNFATNGFIIFGLANDSNSVQGQAYGTLHGTGLSETSMPTVDTIIDCGTSEYKILHVHILAALSGSTLKGSVLGQCRVTIHQF